MNSHRAKRAGSAGWLAVIALLVATLTAGSATAAPPGERPGRGVGATGADFTLTILHNNDGESSLTPTEVDDVEYGGVARFQSKVDELRRSAGVRTWDQGESARRGSILLNSGDNYLAGASFQASQQDGAPFYDALAVRQLGYNALAVGNHEFDFGPATFARFVNSIPRVPSGRIRRLRSMPTAKRFRLSRRRATTATSGPFR